MKKSLLVLLVLIMCGTMVYASGNGEGKAEAEENKVLRLLSWTGYAPDSQITEFERLYGIKVEVTYS